jgi:hypothetical protein
MTWNPCLWHGYGYPPQVKIVHRPECERAAAQGKVPRWTPEDVANLTRRVQRLAAKEAKP